ncbi:hypothetical protein EON63_01365 [archaeon]|nr:MAG: hypothetical protein EON63_01365 [archaeon]
MHTIVPYGYALGRVVGMMYGIVQQPGVLRVIVANNEDGVGFTGDSAYAIGLRLCSRSDRYGRVDMWIPCYACVLYIYSK